MAKFYSYKLKRKGKAEATRNKYYVYTLAHPNGQVFYVGKGARNRDRAHLGEARKGTCHCGKCKMIHAIWREHLEVKIERVFETDDEAEAFEQERQLIRSLEHKYPLFNFQARLSREHYLLPAEVQAQQMTLVEYRRYLSYYLPPREIANLIYEWGIERIVRLEMRQRRAQRCKQLEEVERIQQEIDEVSVAIGNVWQHELPLGFEPIRKRMR